PARGSFRAWLFTVTRNKLIDLRERQRRGQGAGGSSAGEVFDRQPAREDETVWDEEFRRHLFTTAADEVRGEFEEATWSAFWQPGGEGKKSADVAAELGLSVGAVYVAKSRVQARLKQRVNELKVESNGELGSP